MVTIGRKVPRAALPALLFLLPALASAQQAPSTGEPLPDATVLVEQYVRAIGGREAVLRAQTSRTRGRFEVPGVGLEGDLETLKAAPDRISTRITIPGLGEIRTGYDGQVAWQVDPMTGARIMEGPERAGMQAQASAAAAIRDHSLFTSRETVERTEIGGASCYRVKLVWRNGRESDDCYAADSGLLVATMAAEHSPMGVVEVVTLLSEYREFGGVLLPTRAVHRMLGQEQVFITEEVEYEQVDAAAFALPPEIEALRAARATATGG